MGGVTIVQQLKVVYLLFSSTCWCIYFLAPLAGVSIVQLHLLVYLLFSSTYQSIYCLAPLVIVSICLAALTSVSTYCLAPLTGVSIVQLHLFVYLQYCFNPLLNISIVWLPLLSRPLLQFAMWRYWFRLSRYVYGGNRSFAPILRQSRWSLLYDVY